MVNLCDTRPFVLVPLYIYPSEKAWEPLLQAARAHGDVRFVAVVNPDNGPGRGPVPDGSYTAALRRLAEVPNISTLGYVHCSYGERPGDVVGADIDVYRGWSGELAPLDGIFFDETPADPRHVDYMAALADHTRTTWAQALSRDAMVVYNPGVMAAPEYFPSADYIVVFEASEDLWTRRCLADLTQALRHIDADTRSKAVVIIHSSPDQGEIRLGGLLQQLRSLGVTGLYVTDQQQGGYTRWPAAWMQFAEAVAACK